MRGAWHSSERLEVVLQRRSVSTVNKFRTALRQIVVIGGVCRPRISLVCQYRYRKLGWVGKKIPKRILILIRGCSQLSDVGNFHDLLRRRVSAIRLISALMFALIVLGCGHQDLAEPLQSGKVSAWSGLQGRWVGPVAPTDPSCGRETQGLLSIGGGEFGFDPFQSTSVIEGKVTHDGHLVGKLERVSPDHKALSMSFDAAASGSDAIKGQLQSGRCHWAVTLHRG
jgi:hypothetical protein